MTTGGWHRKLRRVKPEGAVPALNAKQFTCPHCAVVSQQQWNPAQIPPSNHASKNTDAAVMRSTCISCRQHAYWIGDLLVWPEPQYGPAASDDLVGELRDLYEEARTVAPRSPRAAAALLRLLVEKVVNQLDAGNGSLNDKIKRLATDGVITRRTVDALDAVRIGGNHAVHGGQIDPAGGDDEAVALMLFTVVNAVVESAVTLPRETEEFLGTQRRPAITEGA